MLIEKSEDIGFPFRDSKIKQVVAIIGSLANGGIDFEQVGLVKTIELGRDLGAGRCVIVVGGLEQHDGSGSLVHGSKGALTQFLGGMPRIGARGEADFDTNGGIMIAGQQSEHSPEGVAYDCNALGVHPVGGLQKRQPGMVKLMV